MIWSVPLHKDSVEGCGQRKREGGKEKTQFPTSLGMRITSKLLLEILRLYFRSCTEKGILAKNLL